MVHPTGAAAPPADGPTLFVYINPLGDCIANPGETYSADYLGQVPAGGCWNDPGYVPQGTETTGDAMCRSILGGAAESWTCFAGEAAGTCAPPSYDPVTKTGTAGTCICGSRAQNGCAP